MVATGEQSGKPGLVTSRIADHYQTELGRKLQLLSKVVEPMMFMVMGPVVGVVISSLILPIFKSSRAVR